MKLLLYCCKAKPYLYKTEDTTYPAYPIGYHTDKNLKVKLSNTNELANLNGKVVAECDFEVEEIGLGYGKKHAMFDENGYFDDYYDYMTETLDEDILLKRSCLNVEEMENYLGTKDSYAIHIKNLHIFDKPKELSECYTKQCQYGKCSTCEHRKKEIPCSTIDTPITKAPQNMMRVWLHENGKWVMYILISIQSQWMCLILNRIKDVEVRRVVLKEMLKNDK